MLETSNQEEDPLSDDELDSLTAEFSQGLKALYAVRSDLTAEDYHARLEALQKQFPSAVVDGVVDGIANAAKRTIAGYSKPR